MWYVKYIVILTENNIMALSIVTCVLKELLDPLCKAFVYLRVPQVTKRYSWAILYQKSWFSRCYFTFFNVVGILMSYLRYLCLFAYNGVQHILSYVFVLFVFVLCLVFRVLSVSLDCLFLISTSVFSNVYFRIL
jgi:hypothetical protein